MLVPVTREIMRSECFICEDNSLLFLECLYLLNFVQGLDLLESTNLKFFPKDMTAEFFALKGLFYSQMER